MPRTRADLKLIRTTRRGPFTMSYRVKTLGRVPNCTQSRRDRHLSLTRRQRSSRCCAIVWRLQGGVWMTDISPMALQDSAQLGAGLERPLCVVGCVARGWGEARCGRVGTKVARCACGVSLWRGFGRRGRQGGLHSDTLARGKQGRSTLSGMVCKEEPSDAESSEQHQSRGCILGRDETRRRSAIRVPEDTSFAACGIVKTGWQGRCNSWVGPRTGKPPPARGVRTTTCEQRGDCGRRCAEANKNGVCGASLSSGMKPLVRLRRRT